MTSHLRDSAGFPPQHHNPTLSAPQPALTQKPSSTPFFLTVSHGPSGRCLQTHQRGFHICPRGSLCLPSSLPYQQLCCSFLPLLWVFIQMSRPSVTTLFKVTTLPSTSHTLSHCSIPITPYGFIFPSFYSLTYHLFYSLLLVNFLFTPTKCNNFLKKCLTLVHC